MQANGVGSGSYIFTDWDVVSQNVAGNYSTINWATYFHFQNSDYQLDSGYSDLAGGRRWSNGGRVYNYAGNISTRNMALASGSFNVGHNNDGSQTIWVAAGINVYQTGRSEAGANYGLPTIPRQALLYNISQDITDEDDPWMDFTNNGGFAVNMWFEFPGLTGGTRYAQRNNIGSRANFNLTTTERNQMRALLANTPTAIIRYVLETNVAGTYMTDWRDRVYSIVNANPTFDSTNISYLDSNATTVAITTDNQKIVQAKSTLRAAFTAATALKGASMANYQVTVDTDVRNFTSAQTAINYATLNVAADFPITVKATDSRGYSTTVAKTVSVLPWTLPRGVVAIQRVNNYEDNTTVKIDVTIDSVNSKNSIQVLKLRKKKTTDATWTENTLVTGVTSTVSMDKLFEWNLEIVITDKFGTTTYVTLLPKGIPIMFIDNVKLSIGVGMFPATNEALEIADKYLIPIMKRVYRVGRIIMTTDITNPGTLPELAGTTWAAWGTGRVPVGVDTSQTEFNTVEKTGGDKNLQSHGHTLNIQNSVDEAGGYGLAAGGGFGNRAQVTAPSFSKATSTSGTGNSQNLQPFITCYFWKRTA